MNITIQEIDDREQWNDFLRDQPHGHLLQSYEWGELNAYVGRDVYRLGALENGRLVGTMQLVVAPVPLPLPKMQPNWLYCSRGPTLARPDRFILARLLEAVKPIAQRERAVALRVEPNIANDDPRIDQDAWLAIYHKVGFQTNPNSVHGRRSWVLDIRPPAEALLAHFDPTWRQHILTAEQKDVRVREAHCESDFETYYELLKVASERTGLFLYAKDYHRKMLRFFMPRRNAVILLAEYEGKVIAAKMLVRFGAWCWDMFEACAEVEDLDPSYLLQYHSLLWAKKRDCHFFDFRTIPEVLSPVEELWSSYEYKKGFGGFSRLNMPTQDYIYQPLIYLPWRRLVELRRDEQRHKTRQAADCEQEETALEPSGETCNEL